jgi:hypothetical protein
MAVGCLLLHGVGADSPWTRLIPGFIAVGLGSGGVAPVVVAISTSVVPREQAGVSAGINNTARQVGTGLGVCVLGAILQGHIEARLHALLGSEAATAAGAVASGSFSPPVSHLVTGGRQALAATATGAFFSGVNELLLLMAGVAMLAAVGGLVLVGSRRFLTGPADPGPNGGSDPDGCTSSRDLP